MTLTASALCRLTDVKDALGIAGTSEDARLMKLIERASARIAAFCNRTFEYSAAIIEEHAGVGTPELVLYRAPVWSIGSITHDGDALDTDEYEIHDGKAGIVRLIGSESGWLHTGVYAGGIAGDAVFGFGRKLYTITYAGGWITPAMDAVGGVDFLPLDIEAACEEFVQTLYYRAGRDRDVVSESLGAHSVSYVNPNKLITDFSGGIPSDVAAALLSYRVVVQTE